MKPFAPACEKNKDAILEVLERELRACARVLEIGTGTGQHAVHFARHLPQLVWLTSDLAEHHTGINAWLEDAALDNIESPVALDVTAAVWPVSAVDAIFSANTMHIMSWHTIERMFHGVGRILQPGGLLALYGPFNYDGKYTSSSNAAFDRLLVSRDPLGGIRNFEDLNGLAEQQGLRLHRDYAMPANNRIIVWRKQLSNAERHACDG